MPKTALVLDDRWEHAHIVRGKLEGQGYAVSTASSLREAVALAKKMHVKGNIDLVVSDVDLANKWLPDLPRRFRHMHDGYKFVLWCKEQGIGKDIVLHSTLFGKEVLVHALGIESRALANVFRQVMGHERWIKRVEQAGIRLAQKPELMGEDYVKKTMDLRRQRKARRPK